MLDVDDFTHLCETVMAGEISASLTSDNLTLFHEVEALALWTSGDSTSFCEAGDIPASLDLTFTAAVGTGDISACTISLHKQQYTFHSGYILYLISLML